MRDKYVQYLISLIKYLCTTSVISKFSDSEFRFYFYRYAKVFNPYVYSATMETLQLVRRTCSRISRISHWKLDSPKLYQMQTPCLQLFRYNKHFTLNLKILESIFSSLITFFLNKKLISIDLFSPRVH